MNRVKCHFLGKHLLTRFSVFRSEFREFSKSILSYQETLQELKRALRCAPGARQNS